MKPHRNFGAKDLASLTAMMKDKGDAVLLELSNLYSDSTKPLCVRNTNKLSMEEWKKKFLSGKIGVFALNYHTPM